MFLAKLWLLPLMTPTRRHAEPHTHTHTHTHTHHMKAVPRRNAPPPPPPPPPSSSSWLRSDVRLRPLKSLKGKKKLHPETTSSVFNRRLLVVVLSASGSAWCFCYTVPFFPGCDAESRHFPVWQEKSVPGYENNGHCEGLLLDAMKVTHSQSRAVYSVVFPVVIQGTKGLKVCLNLR